MSYVIWQEEVTPYVVVELLSPGTEDEDLGENKERFVTQPPSKWEVYEQILQVPYYILFDRYTDLLRAFTITSSGYQELDLLESRIWMPNLQLGLGLWQGNYQGIERQWLRWYDDRGNWVATDAERERYRADVAESLLEQERQRAEQLAERLRSLGIDPNKMLS